MKQVFGSILYICESSVFLCSSVGLLDSSVGKDASDPAPTETIGSVVRVVVLFTLDIWCWWIGILCNHVASTGVSRAAAGGACGPDGRREKPASRRNPAGESVQYV